MFVTRFLSIIAASATVAVSATPLAIRNNSTASAESIQSELAAFNAIDFSSFESSIFARGYSQPSGYTGGFCSTQGCNEQDILYVFSDLKVKVSASLALMDGYRSPIGPCNDIIANIGTSVKLLGAIKVNTSAYGSLCGEIVAVLCEIITGILGCLGKYTLWTILFLCIKIDIVICSLIKACITLIPGILVLISAQLKGHVSLFFSFGFTSTLKAFTFGLTISETVLEARALH